MQLQCLKTDPLLGLFVIPQAMYCIIEGLSYCPTVLRIVATDLSREPELYIPAPTRSAHASNYFLDPSQAMLPATLSACGPRTSYAPVHTNLPLVHHTALSCHAVLTESQSTPNKPLSRKLKQVILPGAPLSQITGLPMAFSPGLPLPLVFLSPAALPAPPHPCRVAWFRCRVRFIQQGVSGVDRSALPRTADSAAAALHAQAHALKAL